MSLYSRATFDDHELVTFHYDPGGGLRAIVAIHARRGGRACGGCRMRPSASDAEALDDVLRLSKAMSHEAALADVAAGGRRPSSLETRAAIKRRRGLTARARSTRCEHPVRIGRGRRGRPGQPCSEACSATADAAAFADSSHLVEASNGSCST